MNLDRLAVPAPEVGAFPRTPGPAPGVTVGERPSWADASAGPARPTRSMTGWRGALAVLVMSLSLFGQGERAHVDPRFISPSSTLETYWAALRAGDANEAWECLVEGRHQLPRPGMLWFLPPTDELSLGAFRSLPVTGGRMLVSYEVSYRPRAGPRCGASAPQTRWCACAENGASRDRWARRACPSGSRRPVRLTSDRAPS